MIRPDRDKGKGGWRVGCKAWRGASAGAGDGRQHQLRPQRPPDRGSPSKFFSMPTGVATPCRLRRFKAASRWHSFPARRLRLSRDPTMDRRPDETASAPSIGECRRTRVPSTHRQRSFPVGTRNAGRSARRRRRRVVTLCRDPPLTTLKSPPQNREWQRFPPAG
jgi:hypothetical protein